MAERVNVWLVLERWTIGKICCFFVGFQICTPGTERILNGEEDSDNSGVAALACW